MVDSRDSSLSPTSEDPRFPSLKTSAIPNGEKRHFTGSLPLHMHQVVDNLLARGVTTDSQNARPTTSGSVKFAAAKDGFPFDAPIGTTRHEPTNRAITDTVNGNDSTANSRSHYRQASEGGIRSQGEPSSPVDPAQKSSVAGNSTPPGRRSVQFARQTPWTGTDGNGHARSSSWDVDQDESPTRNRKGQSLFNKLRALAGPGGLQAHGRSHSLFTTGGNSLDEGTPTGPISSSSDREELRFPGTLEEEGSEIDADGEDSAGEGRVGETPVRKRRRRSRRFADGGPQTAPTTPRSPPVGPTTSGNTTPLGGRPFFLPRRATMTDISEHNRQGVSEDEGRERLAKGSPWRRGSAWVQNARGHSYTSHRRQDSQDPADGKRPSNFRRLTGFGGTADGANASPSPWRLRGERTSSVSAQKWRQLKAGLKMLGQRKKEENRIDHAKSAELLAELLAGPPAALIIASMFQRDEHGHKRVPILLEQLKVRLTDSEIRESKQPGDRHMIFRIELEYGSGPTRMKWVIRRALRDFTNLHLKYKLKLGSEKYIHFKGDESARQKFPHFPRSAFPYLRGLRNLGSEDEDEEEEDAIADDVGQSGAEGAASGTERLGKARKRRSSFNLIRRRSSFARTTETTSGAVATPGAGGRKDTYPARQRKKLEIYLQRMIRHLMFRPESNRLCKFLELSALGVRLAAESSYHGKEGFLVIQSGKGLDFRKAWTPGLMVNRHSPKWFLVRHSYVVCVDSPEAMNIYDVFLVDSEFSVQTNKKRLRGPSPKDLAKTAKYTATNPKHHSLKLLNSERKLKLLAKSERLLHQFEDSIKEMAVATPWAKPNRFESFAPPRSGVFARWLVDGRDHMWNVSRAISMAKDVIYIHDWWLSPEIYMRRPAAISQKWRLDRLLQRKAQEGVKVFVIMYRNIESAIPIDSEYTKFSLLDLHPNVFVQRSPNQFRQNTFFWAHHEKLCIVDHSLAFVGGIDLCFGRWDTPQHSLVDDKLTGFELSDVPKDADHCQLWPGKDYSNPRVQDFYALDKPYEEMYDRTKIARMPWHDISMQVVGQPARDLTRHFVQRWNYVLRQRKPTRPTPFLLPPPDFNPADLEALGLDGTCEVQILRSSCWWSIGTDKTEHSIMNAYIKSIEESEHFVYMENQFFVSSCEVEGTRIENSIGDALVERIIRASRNGQAWRAVIVIPLMPGFQNTVDSQDGTSVRLIMQCQYRSICRGEASIFGRLREQHIDPEDYIQFYSLRTWGRIGPTKQLVTEQLYIHAKCMVVDDRVAIIGSANINERSMLGTRDSECAAIVRDSDTVESTMDGELYLVGRFPHTLRMRLMREHLGLDVDEIMDEERQAEAEHQDEQWERDMDSFHNGDPIASQLSKKSSRQETQLVSGEGLLKDVATPVDEVPSFNHDVDWEQENNPNLKVNKRRTEDARVTGNAQHAEDVAGEGPDNLRELEIAGIAGGRDTTLVDWDKEVLVKAIAPEGKGTLEAPMKTTRSKPPKNYASNTSHGNLGNAGLPPPRFSRGTTSELGLPMLSQLPALPVADDTDIGGPALQRSFSKRSAEFLNPLVADMRRPIVDKDCMQDPLIDSFCLDTWHAVAENNTRLYRTVFRCMPDNDVKSWKEYKDFAAYGERFAQAQGGGKARSRTQQDGPSKSGPPGDASLADKLGMLGPIGEKAGDSGKQVEKVLDKVQISGKKQNPTPMGKVEEWAEDASRAHDQREKDALSNGHKRPMSPADEILDEKASLSTSVSPPLGFAHIGSIGSSGDTDLEKLQRERSPPSVGFPDSNNVNSVNTKRRRRATTKGSRGREFHASDDLLDVADALELMNMTQGHLVTWPYDWLAREEQGGNWLYSIDQLAPLEI
ncbi:MAG: Phospholipase D1 [Candelina mexicana]|nr:MAG: Phospholipase D1 [Candelina mexicana]